MATERSRSGRIAVFLGPTMPLAEADRILDAAYLPPVRNGDVAVLLDDPPAAIAIIDGYFSWVPSVWHKEILRALALGVPVYGASSMGALRAAELDTFGMIGVGEVYECFASGQLQDDDEVAVVHGDADSGYRCLSDAMVNIRATMRAAVTEGVLDVDGAASITDLMKGLHFPDRRLMHIAMSQVVTELLGDAAVRDLRAWLPAHRRDVKRDDARRLLQLLASSGPGAAPSVDFIFETTSNWVQLRSTTSRQPERFSDSEVTGPARAALSDADLLLECRVSGVWPLVAGAALARLDVSHGATTGTPDQAAVDEELAQFCVSRGFERVDDIEAWMASAGYGWNELTSLLAREVVVGRRLAMARGRQFEVALREVLISIGLDRQFERRASAKRAWRLAQDPSTALTRSADVALDVFRCRHGRSASEPLGSLARRHGWDAVDDMYEDLLEDWEFEHDDDRSLEGMLLGVEATPSSD